VGTQRKNAVIFVSLVSKIMAIGTNGDTCSTIAAIFGGETRGSAPYPAKKLFEKSFLDFQKLL
jgi:hypothetical protein